MRRLLALAALPVLLQTPAGAAPTAAVDLFGAHLHGAIGKRDNVVYSPASIALALAMTREGAEGRTAEEMDRVLGATAGREAKAMLTRLIGAPKAQAGEGAPPQLAIANRLFGDRATPFAKPFLDVVRDGYGAPLELVDFRRQVEGARLAINQWVAVQTRDRIQGLLAKGTVSDITRLVLVNAIYLKAQWLTPFAPSATAPAAFAIDGHGTKQVATMRGDIPGTWGTHAGARMVDLPYVSAGGLQLAMTIIVPDQQKLAAIEATLATTGLAPFLAATNQRAELRLALPKFQFGSDFDLGATLAKLGMPRAFRDDAEFGKMLTTATTERLKISKVIHKAWIAVDEKGTEAAGATAVVMARTTSVAIEPPIKPFAVDRSFLFFIHDASGAVLFGGRVVDPTLR
jgi:serpin B